MERPNPGPWSIAAPFAVLSGILALHFATLEPDYRSGAETTRAEASWQAAVTAREAKEPEQAEAHLRRCLELQPNWRIPSFELVRVLSQDLKRHDEALKLLDEIAVANGPRWERTVKLARINVLLNAKRSGEAMELLDEVLPPID